MSVTLCHVMENTATEYVLRTQTDCLNMSENTDWQCLNMSENTDWQCLNMSEDKDWQCLNMSENTDWQCLNMSEEKDWLCLNMSWQRLTVSVYVWGHRLNVSEATGWQYLNVSEDTGWQCLNVSENTDWQCLNMSGQRLTVSVYVWGHRLTVSECVWGHRLTVSQNRVLRGQFGFEGPLHNWCTWQMCKWFFITHRAKWMLYSYISLFGRHLLSHLVVKSLSDRCYCIPTSCLLCYPSYQIILIVHLSQLFCLSSIIESWKWNCKFRHDK